MNTTLLHRCGSTSVYNTKTRFSCIWDQQDELIRFENDMQDLLRDIKFKRHQSEFEKKLARDVK